MKKLYTFILLLFICSIAIGQDFIEHVIDNTIGFIPKVSIADLDGDDNDDIVAITLQSDGLLVWFGDGNGNFENPIVIEDENESSDGRHDIKFLDINNDNILDILATPELDSDSGVQKQLIFYINNGDRTFQNRQFIDFVNINSRSINIIDVDNDNFDDIIVSGFSGGFSELLFYPNLGNGTFGDASVLIQEFGRGILVKDLNNDNLLDIIREFGSPGIFLNGGDGTFTQQDIPMGEIPSFCIFSDVIDQNNSPDLFLLGSGSSGGVGWYSNDGNANFSYEETLNSLANQSHTEGRIADFDGDGDSDLIAGNVSDDQNLYWWRNQGNESFGNFIDITNSTGFVRSLEISDFNEDESIDFVIGHVNGVSWFENNVPLSIEENTIDFLTIAPNPSTGIYKIVGNQLLSQELEIKIYTITGQLISEINNSRQINLSSQLPGIYLADILIGNKKQVFKLIKY